MYFLASTLLFLTAAQPAPYTPPEAPTLEAPAPEAPEVKAKMPEAKSIEHFTAKVTKDRVRLRLEPTLDGSILKELPKNTLLIATGATDEFYAVLPQPRTKAYIFRTYVLDGEIIGNHVNVRLEPDTNAKIVCQLNSGDKVIGQVSATNSRWLEIDMPSDVRFYVAKDYVTKIGPENVYKVLEAKMKGMQEKLALLEKGIDEEFQKPFPQIKLAPFAKELNGIAAQNSDFPEQAQKAQLILKKMQEEYLEKSLNNRTEVADAAPVPTVEQAAPTVHALPAPAQAPTTVVEEAAPAPKAAEKGFETLRGVVRPYSTLAQNSPGDFLLVDAKTNLPKAYLSSSQVNLSNFIGKEVTLTAIEKENNNFAYPAYTVLKAE